MLNEVKLFHAEHFINCLPVLEQARTLASSVCKFLRYSRYFMSACSSSGFSAWGYITAFFSISTYAMRDWRLFYTTCRVLSSKFDALMRVLTSLARLSWKSAVDILWEFLYRCPPAPFRKKSWLLFEMHLTKNCINKRYFFSFKTLYLISSIIYR